MPPASRSSRSSLKTVGVVFLIASIPFCLIAAQLLYAALTKPMSGLGADATKSIAANRSNEHVGVIVMGVLGVGSWCLGIVALICSKLNPSWRKSVNGGQIISYNDQQMSGALPLGTIKNIDTLTGAVDLFIYPDSLVAAEGSYAGTMATAASAGMPILARATVGMHAGVALDEGRVGSESALTANALVNSNTRNSLLPVAEITRAELSKHVLGGRLLIYISDGSVAKLEWKPVYNDFNQVASLLRQVLADKLVGPS